MFLSRQTIKRLGLITPCLDRFVVHSMTAGLGSFGYDLQLDFGVDEFRNPIEEILVPDDCKIINVAAIEHFQMPNNVGGLVCDKSTWARFPKGLVVQNTVIEPGWHGFLTIEISNQGPKPIILKREMPIAQVIFCFLDEPTDLPYEGKYQNQAPGPQPSKAND